MQRAPLAQDFGKGAGIGDLVRGDAGQCIGIEVTDAVAAGLDAVHLHAGQQVQHVRAFFQRDPVELHVGARGEVAVAVAQGRRCQCAGLGGLQCILQALRMTQQFRRRLVVLAGNACQHTQLAAGDFAVRHGNTQHGRVALDIPAVLQAQRLEFGVGKLARAVTLQLVAVLGRALFDELLIERGVLVHESVRLLPASAHHAHVTGQERTNCTDSLYVSERFYDDVYIPKEYIRQTLIVCARPGCRSNSRHRTSRSRPRHLPADPGCGGGRQ